MLDDDLKAHYFGNNLSFVTSRCYTCDLSTFKERDFKFDRKYFKSFWEFFVKEKLGLKIKLPPQPLYQDRAPSFCCQSDLKSACFKVVSCPSRLSSGRQRTIPWRCACFKVSWGRMCNHCRHITQPLAATVSGKFFETVCVSLLKCTSTEKWVITMMT